MKKLILILSLIVISSCQQQLVVERWNNGDQPFVREFRGAEWANFNEIALYGWFRIDPSLIGGGWNNIIILTQNGNFEKETGSRFFGLLVHEKVFEITAITDKNRLNENKDYDPADKGQWTFFHFSYSFKLQKVSFFMKLSKTGVIKASAVVNFNPSQFYRLYVGQGIPHSNKFPGSIINVFLQTGDGAYKESGYEGYLEQNPESLKKCPPLEKQQPVVKKWNNADQPFVSDYRGPQWAESDEMALHGWFKIDPSLIGSGWNNIVILTQNGNFEKETGSRFFGLLVSEKVFEITAITDKNRLHENKDYDTADKGQWTFFHFSYSFKLQKVSFFMKLSKTGVIKATAVVNFNPSQFYRLYVGKGIPHSNKFPGTMANISLQACSGAYKEDGYEVFQVQSPETVKKCPPIDQQKPVIEKWNNADQPYASDYRGEEWAESDEIALHGWFKIDPSLIGSGWNNIVILTQNGNFEKETGSRFFGLLVSEKVFEITAITDKNRLHENKDYDTADKGQWTFFHFSYSFKLQKVSFFMKLSKTGVIKASAVVNFNPSQFYRLYVGKGIPHSNKFPGAIAKISLQACSGAYKEDGYEVFLAQNPEPVKKCPPIDQQKPVIEKWNNADQPFVSDHRGDSWAQLDEIALWGWFKVDPSLIGSGWNNIVILTQKENFENETGSRFFGLLFNEKQFEITAISDKNRLHEYKDYNVADRGQWAFFHFSYSFVLQKVVFYMKLSKTGEVKASNIVNFSSSSFYRLYVGKGIPHNNKFPGKISFVFLQPCNGAYKESGYEGLIAQNPEFEFNSCAIIYSKCDFEGEAVNLCEKTPFPPEKIKSIYVPPKIQIKILNPKDSNQKVIYTQSVSCITQLKYSLFLGEKEVIVSKKTALKKNKRSKN